MSDNSSHTSNLMQGIWTTAILSGLLAVVLGVVILAWPQPSVVAAAALFGVYLVVSGIALVILAFSLPASGGNRFLNFISGVASVALGVLAFRHFGEGYAVLLLAIWIAIGFIIRGAFVTASAITVPTVSGSGVGDFLWNYHHHRRLRDACIPLRFDRDVGPCGRSLADHPRRHGGHLRAGDAQRREEGRKDDRHRSRRRDAVMSHHWPVAELTDVIT